MERRRPDPDELLKSLDRESKGRGRLKVFLGASPGVGKTYAMLEEAVLAQSKGADVAVGFIETHGREETQNKAEGLESIPLRQFEHRGTAFLEPDIEAILARQPQLVLLDELPHTNAPGSRHRKRWQDLEDLLDAGIDVYTAMNIQHLESLNDVVAQVTGVRVSETVPDAFLERADEIELIDIPPAELQERLRDGKVYIPDKIDQALQGFFKTSNLTALRELALRRAADKVDADVQRLRTQEGAPGPWATRDRVIVCVAPNRMAGRVVRSAARLGAASHAELIAVTVDSDRQAARSEGDRAAAREALDLAQELGMEVVSLSGHDIVAEVFDLARRRNATLVVVGKPIRPRWKEILFGSVVDEMVRRSGDVDVMVITADGASDPIPMRPQVTGFSVAGSMASLAAPAAATALGFVFHGAVGESSLAMVYVLAVALAAMAGGRRESAGAAVLSVLCFNFFFVEPRFTLAVADARYLLVFGVMLCVALVISTLTHRMRSQIAVSSTRERQVSSLYRLTQLLARARSKADIGRIGAQEISGVFDGEAAVFIVEGGRLTVLAPTESRKETFPSESAVASWTAAHSQPAGTGTNTLPGSEGLYLPLKGGESVVGVLAWYGQGEPLDQGARRHLEAFAGSLGLALERTILAKESNDARVLAESERTRSAILSSISHDLRTPLTSITGAASLLRSTPDPSGQLVESIYHESIRLNRQIQNLLDMTRLQGKGVEPSKDWHSPADLAAAALEHSRSILAGREVKLDSDPSAPLIQGDGLLVEKALINLLENAVRHGGPNVQVTLSVRQKAEFMVFEVQDTGPGLPPWEEASLFEFGRTTQAGGAGLGLAVVKAVADLHQGVASAANRPGGGSIFALSLPLPSRQPEVPLG